MRIKDFINSLSAIGKRCFTITEIKAALGTSDKSVWNAIDRLKASGELASPAKGLYLIIPPEYRMMQCLPPELFIRQLMEYWKMPYYVCLESAAMYYGAAHQQPQVFNVKIPKNRPVIQCGKVRIAFIAKKQLSRTPVQSIKTAAGHITVSTPEATAMDLVCDARRCGGMNVVLTILEELVDVIKAEPLLALANSSIEKQWIQRLGYLLDELEFTELSKILHQHLKRHKIRVIPLASYLPVVGSKINLKWKIAINTTVESDL